jgi:HEAT repeat protein
MTVNRRTISIIVIIAVVLGIVLGITEWQRSVATTKLLAVLSTDDYSKVLDAMDQLPARGSRVVGPLLKILQGSEPAGRWRAATLLGEIGSKAAWAPLQEALRSDKSAEVRQAAAQALGKLSAKSAGPDLCARVKDPSENMGVRVAAAGALGLMGDRDAVADLEAIVADRAEALATQAAADAKKADDAKKAAEAKALADQAAALKAAGLPVPPAPKPAPAPPGPPPPTDTRLDLRVAAARSLGVLGKSSSIAVLTDSLDPAKEPAAEVRTAVAYAMGDLARTLQDDADMTRIVNGLLKPLDIDAKVEAVGDVRAAAIHSLSFCFLSKESSAQVEKVLGKCVSNDDFYWAREAAKDTMKTLNMSVPG